MEKTKTKTKIKLSQYPVDRRMKIDGTRLLARREEISDVSPLILQHFDLFAAVHQAFLGLVTTRQIKEVEAWKARLHRDQKGRILSELLRSAYDHFPSGGRKTWKDILNASSDSNPGDALRREAAFPAGKPILGSESLHGYLDCADHLLAWLDRDEEERAQWDPELVDAIREHRKALAEAIDAVTRTADDATRAGTAVQESRVGWQVHYDILDEVAYGMLKLAGREAVHARLFRRLPSRRVRGNAVASEEGGPEIGGEGDVEEGGEPPDPPDVS